MPRWLASLVRDGALAVVVVVSYSAGSFMVAMLLAALLGTTLDAPYTLREELALLAASISVAGGILVLQPVLREERLPAWRPLRIGQALAQLVGGLLAGMALVALTVAVFWLAGWYTAGPPVIHAPAAALTLLGPALFSALVVATTEELLERRLLFPVFERSLGTWLALGLSAAWFGVSHLGNPHAGPAAALGIALGGGVAYTLAFIATRRVWLSIGLHWGWNSALGPLFGLQVSGLDRAVFGPALLPAGPALWTGGAFGPEAGLVALLAHVPLHGALLWLIVRQQRSVPPVWRRSPGPAPVAELRDGGAG